MTDLLITLGDSWTEGVGCYLPETRESFKLTHTITHQEYLKNRDNFHINGWPTHLQRMLGYEQLVNFGLGGSSIAGVFKNFIDKYDNKDFSVYDNITMVWLLTYPARLGFYSGGEICNITPHDLSTDPVHFKKLRDAYYNFIVDEDDIFREAFFLIKIMNGWCKSRNINFIFSVMDETMSSTISKYYKYDNFFPYVLPNQQKFPHLFSEICGHPNENGYKYIAENMFVFFKEKFSHLINATPAIKYTMLYEGDIINHSRPTIYETVL